MVTLKQHAGKNSATVRLKSAVVHATRATGDPITAGNAAAFVDRLKKARPEQFGHGLDNKTEAKRARWVTDKNLKEWHEARTTTSPLKSGQSRSSSARTRSMRRTSG